jgi:hypothetical protein
LWTSRHKEPAWIPTGWRKHGFREETCCHPVVGPVGGVMPGTQYDFSVAFETGRSFTMPSFCPKPAGCQRHRTLDCGSRAAAMTGQTCAVSTSPRPDVLCSCSLALGHWALRIAHWSLVLCRPCPSVSRPRSSVIGLLSRLNLNLDLNLVSCCSASLRPALARLRRKNWDCVPIRSWPSPRRRQSV